MVAQPLEYNDIWRLFFSEPTRANTKRIQTQKASFKDRFYSLKTVRDLPDQSKI